MIKDVKIKCIPKNETILFAEKMNALYQHSLLPQFVSVKFIITDKAFYCRRRVLITGTFQERIDEIQKIHIKKYLRFKNYRLISISTISSSLSLQVNLKTLEEIIDILLNINPFITIVDETNIDTKNEGS